MFPLRVQPPAAAPEGTNYFLDGSTGVVSSGQPHIVLASFAGIPRTSSFPPDPVIAAGPHHLLAAVNREIRIFEKNGTLLQVYSAAAWFNAVVPGCAPYDPRVLYDHFAGRFVMLWHHYGFQPNVSYYLLSMSETDDPTGSGSRPGRCRLSSRGARPAVVARVARPV